MTKNDVKWHLPERQTLSEDEILRLYKRCMDDNDKSMYYTGGGGVNHKRDNNCAKCRRNFGDYWEADKSLRTHYKDWFIRLCARCSSGLVECELCQTIMKPHEAIIDKSGIIKCRRWISHPSECVCCDDKPSWDYLWSFEGRRDMGLCQKCIFGSWLCHKCKCIRGQGLGERPHKSCSHCNARKAIYIRDDEDVWNLA